MEERKKERKKEEFKITREQKNIFVSREGWAKK